MEAMKRPWLIEDGTFVYQLNEKGINVFSFQVQGGYKDDGTKTTQADKEQIAALIVRSVATFDQAREALKAIEMAYENRGEETSLYVWNERMKQAMYQVRKAIAAMEATHE